MFEMREVVCLGYRFLSGVNGLPSLRHAKFAFGM
jgi:hypothetical protein